MRKKIQSGYYNYVGIYTFSFIALGMLVPLVGQYLSSIGFTGVQIGIVTATATTVGIFASPFWGCRYHRSTNSVKIVLILCTTVPLVAISLIFIDQFVLFLILYALYAFFQMPIMPLCDAMTLEARMPFGAVRKWGAIGFALGVFTSGQIANATSLVMIFPLSAISYSIAGLVLWRMLKKSKKETTHFQIGNSVDTSFCCEKKQSPNLITQSRNISNKNGNVEIKEKSQGYIVLFKNKKFIALLFSAFFICGTNVANNIYFGFLYTDAGGSIAGIGVAFLLMCGSEAPFMAWIEKISSKLTLEKMILVSMLISSLRYLWYGTGTTPELLIGTFFLQGMVNGVVLIELVRYIAKLVEPEMIGMAMTLYQAISSNCSTILCQLIGGAILDKYDSLAVYLFFGIFNLIGIILYVGFGLHKNYQKKE